MVCGLDGLGQAIITRSQAEGTSRGKSPNWMDHGHILYCEENRIVMRAGMMKREVCQNYKRGSTQQRVIHFFMATLHAVIVGVFVCVCPQDMKTWMTGMRCMVQTGNLWHVHESLDIPKSLLLYGPLCHQRPSSGQNTGSTLNPL